MRLEELFTVHVNIEKSIELHNSVDESVVMITFTGNVTGKYFEGLVLDGGVDTQIIREQGNYHTLSARYMLQGTDYTGQTCQIYIENNGNMDNTLKTALFRTAPKMVTNSKALSFLNSDTLVSEGYSTATGVDIKIYRKLL